MLNRTEKIYEKYEELTKLVVDANVIADNKKWQELVKERSKIEDIANAHIELEKVIKQIAENEKALEDESDEELIALFEEDLNMLKHKREELNNNITLLLLPKDENDDKNIIMEIRPAAGGDEAGLFASTLMNMYIRFAEKNKWKVAVNDIDETEIGGLKNATLTIKGKDIYASLKFESGVHRVQRVPETESQGRVHTSTVTVAVMPEIENVDFAILEKDLKVDTYRSSGAGGQHVNTTDSAIRITHLPTGVVVACQEERSQIKNREKAMSMLKTKLYDYYSSKIESEYSQNRKNLVGTGDRSERIRTYNYPQGRITDHRINYSIFSMQAFLDGDIGTMIEELQSEDQKQKLEMFSKDV